MTDSATSRFEMLLESAPDGIVLADTDGRITLVNRRTEELFGYARHELLGQPVEMLVPDRFRERHLRHRAGYAADPRRREMGAELELNGLRKDGSEFPVEIGLSPLSEGDEALVITIIRDVSERRSADARFRVLLESAPDAIVLVDSTGRIELVNRRTEELFGYQPGELIGSSVETLVPERFRSLHVGHRAGYAADPRTREMGADLELYGRREDGSEFPVEISLSPMRVGGDELVITIVRDVSERRAAELERIELAREQSAHAEAETGRDRLASILGEIDAVVWETDTRRNRFTFVSRRAEGLLGYPLARWLSEDGFWRRITHPDDVELAELFFQESIGRGEDHEHEYRIVDVEERTLWVHDRVRIVRNEDGGVQLHGVTFDVTARRELEERLLQSQKMDAVGQLAGGVAHDFNNLLVVISGYTDLLLARLDDETALGQLREIGDAARRASALTAQLLAFGRRAPTVVEVVDLNVLIHGLEPMLRRLIDEDIVLTVDVPDVVGRIRGDTGQLEQVVMNLVINARDALPLGGEIRVEAATLDLEGSAAVESALAPGRWISLSVSDNGSGMSSETKARIFEPFFTTKEQGKGSGLGLATVYGIVEQAGGHVTVDTELGRGTTFVLAFPGVPDEDDGEPTDEGSSGPAVLVVEKPSDRGDPSR